MKMAMVRGPRRLRRALFDYSKYMQQASGMGKWSIEAFESWPWMERKEREVVVAHSKRFVKPGFRRPKESFIVCQWAWRNMYVV